MNLHSFTQWTYSFAFKKIYIDTRLKMHSDGNIFKIRGVCFKCIYIMTYQSLSSTFQRNIFYTKILANAPLTPLNINWQDWKYTFFIHHSQNIWSHNANFRVGVVENIGLKLQFQSLFLKRLILHKLYRWIIIFTKKILRHY